MSVFFTQELKCSWPSYPVVLVGNEKNATLVDAPLDVERNGSDVLLYNGEGLSEGFLPLMLVSPEEMGNLKSIPFDAFRCGV